MNDSGDSVMWLNKKQLNKNKKPQQHALKWSGSRTRLKMNDKAVNVPRNIFIAL